MGYRKALTGEDNKWSLITRINLLSFPEKFSLR